MNDYFNHISYVGYELALALRKAGYHWCSDRYYIENRPNVGVINPDDYPDGELVCAPTLAVVQRWVRETLLVSVCVMTYNGCQYSATRIYLDGFKETAPKWFRYDPRPMFATYEEALADGLGAVLKIYNNEK